MLENAVALVNGKGGVGKTSVAANVGATAALGGWRVLLVDLDPQGNLARDLGYGDRSDHGRALFEAVLAGGAPDPLSEVRPSLDVVSGGRYTSRLIRLLTMQHQDKDVGEDYDLAASLEPLGSEYDLVVVDCPHVSAAIVPIALRLVHYALIPTKIDDGSIDGLERVAAEIEVIVRDDNPQLYVLGVVMFDVGAGDRALRAQARHELTEMLDGIAPVLDSTVRTSRRGAYDMRRNGQVAYEYERAALEAKPWFEDRSAQRPSKAASGLAGDYQRLTEEVIGLLSQRRAAETADAPGGA